MSENPSDLSFLFSLSTAIPPVICGLLMPNFYLGNTQNAVDGTQVDGRKTVESRTAGWDHTKAPEDQVANPTDMAPQQKRKFFFF